MLKGLAHKQALGYIAVQHKEIVTVALERLDEALRSKERQTARA
jgi:hypothetical protein